MTGVVAKNLDFELQAAEEEEENEEEMYVNYFRKFDAGAPAKKSSRNPNVKSSTSSAASQKKAAADAKKKLIRVVCRVKKTKLGVSSCIKQMTSEAVHIWSLSSTNAATHSSKKRKHNTSQDTTTSTNAYTFDRVYGSNTTQQSFYEGEVQTCVENLLQGKDSTIFAYGNTNSGKSYTIFGHPKSTNPKTTEGVLFRVVKDIFCKQPSGVELKISAFEIYNEKVYDLLSRNLKERHELKWRTYKNRPVKIEGLQTFTAKTIATAETLLKSTAENRSIASTNLNSRSSRSHCVFTVQVYKDGKALSKLYIVDLAGSERATRTKATGNHLKEANNINQSLMTLNRCLRIMRKNQDSTNNKQHVPFRDSKLTGFFMNNLTNPQSGAIIMIVNINPDLAEHSETISVLENSSVAKDVTYTRQTAEKSTGSRVAKYDSQGRRIKSKKQLAAESKRIIEAATANKKKSKKMKLATSQNIDSKKSGKLDGSANIARNSKLSQKTVQGVSKASKQPTRAIKASVEHGSKDAVSAATTNTIEETGAATLFDESALRDKIRAEVIAEYRQKMQMVMQAQLVTAQHNTEQAVTAVEALWQARFQELKTEHAKEIAEMQNRDIDDKDTLHIEIDGLTTQKVSLHAKLRLLEEENADLRKQLELQVQSKAASVPLAVVNGNRNMRGKRSTAGVSESPCGGGAAIPEPDENQVETVVPVETKRYFLRKRK